MNGKLREELDTLDRTIESGVLSPDAEAIARGLAAVARAVTADHEIQRSEHPGRPDIVRFPGLETK